MEKVTQLGLACCLWHSKSVVTDFSEGNLKGKTICVKTDAGKYIEVGLKVIGHDVRHRVYLILD